MRLRRDQACFGNLVFPPTEKGLPPAAPGPGAEGQSGPPWITITPQKRRGAPEQPPNQEDKPGAQTLEPEIGKPAKAPERAQVGAESNAFLSLWVWGRDGPRPRGNHASCLVVQSPWPGCRPRPLGNHASCLVVQSPWPGCGLPAALAVQGCQGGGGAGRSLGRERQLCSCLLGNEHLEKWSRLK